MPDSTATNALATVKNTYKVDDVKIVRGHQYMLNHAFGYKTKPEVYYIRVTSIDNSQGHLKLGFTSPDTHFNEITFDADTTRPISKSTSKSKSSSKSKSGNVFHYKSKPYEYIDGFLGGSSRKKIIKRNRKTMKRPIKK
jgi:hypothetical protein